MCDRRLNLSLFLMASLGQGLKCQAFLSGVAASGPGAAHASIASTDSERTCPGP